MAVSARVGTGLAHEVDAVCEYGCRQCNSIRAHPSPRRSNKVDRSGLRRDPGSSLIPPAIWSGVSQELPPSQITLELHSAVMQRQYEVPSRTPTPGPDRGSPRVPRVFRPVRKRGLERTPRYRNSARVIGRPRSWARCPVCKVCRIVCRIIPVRKRGLGRTPRYRNSA